MEDYGFMKTGFNNDNNDNNDNNCMEILNSMLIVFTEDAIKIADIYTEHSNREIITPLDIKKALKVRSYYGEHFWKLPDVQERIKELIDSQKETDCSDCSSMDIEEEEDVDEMYALSTCKCNICEYVNNIEEQWVNWNPSSPIEIALKDAVNVTENV